jgi:predicted transposase YbfD/YdcC
LSKKTLALALLKEADVVVQVKGNQPTLLEACEDLARHQAPGQCDVTHDKAHGRIEVRTVHTFEVPPHWLPEEWQLMVRQVARIERTIERRTREGWVRTAETAWWISTTCMSAADFQLAIRGHWSVENQNHYVRDVVLREDACRTRHRPAVFARLRSMALNCLRAASVQNVTVELHRHAMNFERLRKCACGTTKT